LIDRLCAASCFHDAIYLNSSADGAGQLLSGTMRYWPDEAILNGTWHPFALERVP
jgi:hypothetical protein